MKIRKHIKSVSVINGSITSYIKYNGWGIIFSGDRTKKYTEIQSDESLGNSFMDNILSQQRQSLVDQREFVKDENNPVSTTIETSVSYNYGKSRKDLNPT